MEDEAFAFLDTIPDELTHGVYCANCHGATVQPALELYQQNLKKAGEVFLFDKKIKQVPVIKQSQTKIFVSACKDKQEMILRLAFKAVALSYNAIVKTVLVCEKVKINGYQTSNWSGSGYPANVNKDKVDQDMAWENKK